MSAIADDPEHPSREMTAQAVEELDAEFGDAKAHLEHLIGLCSSLGPGLERAQGAAELHDFKEKLPTASKEMQKGGAATVLITCWSSI